MMGVKLQGVGLVPGAGAMRVATFVGSVGVEEGIDIVAGSGAAQAAMVASTRIVIKIVLEFVFKLTSYGNTRESIPLRRVNLRKGEQDYQMSPTVNPSGNGSSASTT